MIIEKTVIEYLASVMPDVPCYAERQTPDPDSFLIIEKTGSSKTNRIETSTVAVQSFGPTKLSAAELNERVKENMENMIERPDISAVYINSDYPFTDTASKRYRYQAVFVITHY